MQHLTQHNILYPLHHGFCKKRSCKSQLIESVNDIAFNMQKGHQNDVVVMSLKHLIKLLTTDCFTNCNPMGLREIVLVG